MIKLTDLSKVYKTEEVQTTALNNISLNIKQGEFIAIMGPSGCGKSTLLNILGLLDKASSGSYELLGTETTKLSTKRKSDLRKKNIGFIFQNFNLIDELSVYENIELPLIYNGVPSSERKKRVTNIMEKIGIAHRFKHYPQQLSGGQQQRVAVARALVNNPHLILADEPTGNLDSSNGNEVMNLLAELHKEGSTIVMVTHSSYDAGFASRIVNMKDGEIFSEKDTEQRKDVFTELPQ
ncbi:MAG: ABC transporter ATP-binding protein [Weeksellaceae bacterium]